MTGLVLPPIEDIDIDDLVSLPRGYRYELHEGNLVIMTPTTFWHKDMARRLMFMLHATGVDVFQDPGVKSGRPRDCRLPDVGVVTQRPAEAADYSNLPGSAYSLVIEVVSENSVNGEYTDKPDWYAKRGIPEYWIVERTEDRVHDDATVLIHRLEDAKYVLQRTVLLSELEAGR